MSKPNYELLTDLFHSDGWQALKTEIEICKHNALTKLVREVEQDRDGQAGEVRMADRILGLELKYKNPEMKIEPRIVSNVN